MSAHMKKHLTKSSKAKILKISYKGNAYHIPKKVADEYKIGPVEESVLADDLFTELDKKYTKPGVLLRGLRYRENLSQVEFAELIAVTQSDLSKMEHGKRTIGKTLAKRIAEQFDIDYRYFL